jgi:hypothetical protein
MDTFDGLTPLHEWLSGQHPGSTAWALQAILALADTSGEVGWEGDMRHLPMVGGLPTLGATTPYLVVKQDNNCDTFVITTDTDIHPHAIRAKATPRTIGAGTPDETDGPDEPAF